MTRSLIPDVLFQDMVDSMFGSRPSQVATRADYPLFESLVKDGKLVVRCDVPGVDPQGHRGCAAQ